jgi:hypothetical protein
MKLFDCVAIFLLACLATLCGVADAGSVQLTAQAIATGGGRSASPGGCRRLEATIGEPVAGRASGGSFVVIAGFQGRVGALPRDSIFHDGFQECQ